MIDVKEAVKAARDFVAHVYEDQVASARLEEVELDGSFWFVTLGLARPTPTSALSAAMGQEVPRSYKIFKIDAATGEVRSMKMRK